MSALHAGISSMIRALGRILLVIAVLLPVLIAAASPLQTGRGVAYVVGGLAGVVALAMLLLQPLLAVGWLPGVEEIRARRWHRWLGSALVVTVLLHIAGLFFASPPDMLDALLLVAPTPFSVYGVIALWSLLATALLVGLRSRIASRPATWRIVHNGLAVVVVFASVVHALMIDGAMGRVSKILLCTGVLVAIACATWQRRMMTPRRSR